jgi:hypothetical protein
LSICTFEVGGGSVVEHYLLCFGLQVLCRGIGTLGLMRELGREIGVAAAFRSPCQGRDSSFRYDHPRLEGTNGYGSDEGLRQEHAKPESLAYLIAPIHSRVGPNPSNEE